MLDWTEGIAGPYACQVLGDLGADVVKIERPQGDWQRGGGRGGSYFRAVNRNKRDLCLDLKSEGALDIAWRLIATADVMVTSYRPGVMERLGLGFESVHARFAHLVYARISAYGNAGPLSEQPGTDTVIQGMSGLMSRIGEPGSEPQRTGVAVVDFMTGRDVVLGVLAALLARATGRPMTGPVDASLFASAASLQSQVWQQYFDEGTVPAREGRRHPFLAPAGQYLTADGAWIAIVTARDEHWRKLCGALGLPELVDDPRFAGNEARFRNRDELDALIGPVFASRSRKEWLESGARNDVLFAPVNDLGDIAADAGLMGSIPLITLPEGLAGPSRPAIALPIASGARQLMREEVRPPPGRGEHTREILTGAGYSKDQIDALIAANVVAVVAPVRSGT